MRTVVAVSIGWVGISMVSDGVPALLLPHQLLAGGHGDAATLGIATLVGIGLGAVLQPLAGRWSDGHGRAPTIAIGVAVAAAGLGLLFEPSMALVGAVAALVGVSIVQAGYQPLVPDRVPRHHRGRAAGAKGACDVGGAFIAFLLLAGLLGAGLPVAAAVLLAGALGGFLLVAHLLLPGPGASADDGRRDRRSSLIDAYRLDLAAHGRLVTLVVGRFLFLLGIYVVGRFLLLFIADRQNLTPDAAGAQAGGVLALLALLTVAASLPAGWLADRAGRRSLILVGGALAAAGIGLLPIAETTEVLLVFGGLMAIGSAAFSAGSWALLTDLTPGGDAGRLMGIAHLGTAGAAALAGAFGLLIDAGNEIAPESGYLIAFGMAGIAALVGGFVAARTASEPGEQVALTHAQARGD